MDLWAQLQELYPALRELNFTAAWMQEAIADSAGPAELAARVRQTSQYKQRFQGMYRADGTQRWTEAEHIRRENDLRTVLRNHGVNVDAEYRSPVSLISFHESEMAPDILNDRLEIWDYVKTAGQRVKETFYGYAGLSITDDDLFESVVDGGREQQLYTEYNQAKAALAFDYPGFIARAHELANGRVATELERLRQSGALTGQAVQRILSIDPAFGRQMMDMIYTGGTPGGGTAGTLDLQTLLNAYEFSAIGAAAQEAGLVLPTRERLFEIRAAGVEREQAMKGYREYGRDQNKLAAAVARARGVGFGQTQFEAAEFLGNAGEARNLTAGINYMEAAGKGTGSFRFAEDKGRITQLGFTAY
jgi:hypothetical protein